MNYINIALLALVAVFTGLYWWDARRAFLLELDRVVLWFRLEGSEKTKIPESDINEITTKIVQDLNIPSSKRREVMRKYKEDLKHDEMIKELTGHIAFLKTLRSKSLISRLEEYEKEQKKLVFDLRNSLEKAKREERK